MVRGSKMKRCVIGNVRNVTSKLDTKRREVRMALSEMCLWGRYKHCEAMVG